MPRRKARVRFGKFTSSLRRLIQLMANLWDEWAYARKTAARLQGIANEVRKEVVYQREYVGLGGAILKILRKLAG